MDLFMDVCLFCTVEPLRRNIQVLVVSPRQALRSCRFDDNSAMYLTPRSDLPLLTGLDSGDTVPAFLVFLSKSPPARAKPGVTMILITESD